MTVNDLIKQLQAMSDEDRERVVVIRKDANGSRCCPLRSVDIDLFIPPSRSCDNGVVSVKDLQIFMGLVPVN